MSICIYCCRTLTLTADGWIDLNATGDDEMWQTVCDCNDSFPADHEGEEYEEAVS